MNNIKEYLDMYTGITQRALIRQLKQEHDVEVKKSMMCSYVNNEHQPSLFLIKKISRVLGVPLDELIND